MSGALYKKEELKYMLNNFYRIPVVELSLRMAKKFGVKRSASSLYGKWKCMMDDIALKYQPRPLLADGNTDEEIAPGITPYQKHKINMTKIPAAVSTRELIMAMAGAGHSIKSLSRDIGLPGNVVRDMVTKTGVPKKHAAVVRLVLGIDP